MKPSSFKRHDDKNQLRFKNGDVEVFGAEMEHICWARDTETAIMIASALELTADLEDNFYKEEK